MSMSRKSYFMNGGYLGKIPRYVNPLGEQQRTVQVENTLQVDNDTTRGYALLLTRSEELALAHSWYPVARAFHVQK